MYPMPAVPSTENIVAIRCPPNSGSLFHNYKGFFSVLLMAVVDADYKCPERNAVFIQSWPDFLERDRRAVETRRALLKRSESFVMT